MGRENIRADQSIYEYMVENLDDEFIKENLNLLSYDGSGRNVYALSNNIVVKLAKSETGKKQNQNEFYVYEQVSNYQKMKDSMILSDIAGICEDEIIQEDRRVNIARNLQNIIATVYAISNSEEILLMERLVGSCNGSIDTTNPAVKLLIQKFSLYVPDIESKGSWMCDEDNNNKLVDYGCTDEIAEDVDFTSDILNAIHDENNQY
ncbi:hypothetical protein [Bacillus paramobilis]|uniref:hypothetical protein n=1 Tax=Bacillus paramobilis TaxID=2817477 RepID=UPI003D262577